MYTVIVSYNSHVNDFVLYLNCDMYLIFCCTKMTQIKNLYTLALDKKKLWSVKMLKFSYS